MKNRKNIISGFLLLSAVSTYAGGIPELKVSHGTKARTSARYNTFLPTATGLGEINKSVYIKSATSPKKFNILTFNPRFKFRVSRNMTLILSYN